MALFPIASDKVQLTTAAVAGTDNFCNGILINSLNTLARAATTGGALYSQGFLMSNSGQVIYVDATAGLPANTTFSEGVPFAPTGELCISTGATVTWSNGLPFVANGALSAQITP